MNVHLIWPNQLNIVTASFSQSTPLKFTSFASDAFLTFLHIHTYIHMYTHSCMSFRFQIPLPATGCLLVSQPRGALKKALLLSLCWAWVVPTVTVTASVSIDNGLSLLSSCRFPASPTLCGGGTFWQLDLGRWGTTRWCSNIDSSANGHTIADSTLGKLQSLLIKYSS